MPILREYVQNSKKSGFYIQANVGGQHPITLQVTPIAETIFRKINYQANDSVPSKLVWAMYNLSLLYTKKSLDPENVKEVSPGDVLSGLNLGNRLSESERAKLISYLEMYEGPNKTTLTELKNELATATGITTGTVHDGGNYAISLSEVPVTTVDAVSHLFMITTGATAFRDAKNRINRDYLLQSLQAFMPHPYANHDAAKLEAWSFLRYPLDLPGRDEKYWITDCRGLDFPTSNPDIDYTFHNESGTVEVLIKDGNVVDANFPTEGEYGPDELDNDIGKILPVDYGEQLEDRLTKYTEYNGLKLEPIQAIESSRDAQLTIVEVDRISENGNAVIIVDDRHFLLDQGEPGCRYLAKKTETKYWMALSKVVE